MIKGVTDLEVERAVDAADGTLDGDIELPRPGAPLAVGYRGGFFHPVTGYSLPLAARVALAVSIATAATAQE